MSGHEGAAPPREPWQAQALATAFSLQDAGLITAGEWSNALGAAIKRAHAHGDPDDGSTYFHHVLDALETLLGDKDLVHADELDARKREWEKAYRATPHGQPVSLDQTP